MTRELLLLRHGKSDWQVDCSDFDRPLKNRGKRGAQRMGVWLEQQACIPDLVISSPAQRALSTAQKCCKTFGMNAQTIQTDERIYLAEIDELLQVLADCPADKQRVLLVGHNPGLEQLLCYLADQPPLIPEDGKLLPTATLARLNMPDDWHQLGTGEAYLLHIQRASALNEKFPYPRPGAEELRERPAYYYTQSAVIPYQMQEGQLHIMIIRSSANKHWVVPKGIADPGLSLAASAAKEAYEEAGVSGEVDDHLLGEYQYAKWGAVCTVSVYAMHVTQQLDDAAWQEKHRTRKWVPAIEAAALIKQTELAAMVRGLNERIAPCQN